MKNIFKTKTFMFFIIILIMGWLTILSFYIYKLKEMLTNDGRKDGVAGIIKDSDAIKLNDRSSQKNNFLEIGRYNYGWTFLTPHRIEFHPADEVSISCYGDIKCLPKFQVRNIGDTEGAVWINGNNIIGSQFGPIKFAFGSFNYGGKEIARFEKNGSLVLQHDLIVNGESYGKTISELQNQIKEIKVQLKTK